jgi:hypothetical protein
MLSDAEIQQIAMIVDEEVKKVLPALFGHVRRRLLNETSLKVVEQLKANKKRPCLGDHVEAAQQCIARSGPKGQTLTEFYNIPFLSFSYQEKE